MLRVKQRSESARLLDDRDRAAALEVCGADPVANVFVESRIRIFGLDPGRLGAQLWGFEQGGRLASLCYSGANLVPVQATPAAVAAFADRALRQGRRCSSLVGPSAAVGELWRLVGGLRIRPGGAPRKMEQSASLNGGAVQATRKGAYSLRAPLFFCSCNEHPHPAMP